MSLTDTAFYTRRAINWAILGVISYVILRIVWGVLVTVFLILFPPKAPPPNHAFGKLPAIRFPAVASSSATPLTYQLQTIEGGVPNASASAKVFFMPKTAPTLLALNKAQDFAIQLSFDPTPIQESKTIYRFNDATLSLRRLRYDIVSNNFIVRYAFEQDPSVFVERNLPTSDAAILDGSTLLQSNDIYADDLANGTSKVSFWKLNGGQLIATPSLSNADAVRVDYFRQPIENTPVYTQDPTQASVSLMFSGSSNPKKHLLQLAYTFWPVDYQTYATYALKPSSQAWQELQNGLGYIAHRPTQGSTIVIRNIHLGYYDSFDPQTYMQPIFVFEGDNGFVAYVPAVAAPWVE